MIRGHEDLADLIHVRCDGKERLRLNLYYYTPVTLGSARNAWVSFRTDGTVLVGSGEKTVLLRYPFTEETWRNTIEIIERRRSFPHKVRMVCRNRKVVVGAVVFGVSLVALLFGVFVGVGNKTAAIVLAAVAMPSFVVLMFSPLCGGLLLLIWLHIVVPEALSASKKGIKQWGLALLFSLLLMFDLMLVSFVFGGTPNTWVPRMVQGVVESLKPDAYRNLDDIQPWDR